jgi:hypothetical protein
MQHKALGLTINDGQSIVFENYRSKFAWDGSLRDLYVQNTTLSEWTYLLDFLKSSNFKCAYFINGAEADLPTDAAQVFEQRRTADTTLTLWVSRVGFKCHFFTENEIEFDFDPREVTDDQALIDILQFMSNIGKALNKRMVLTPENAPEAVIFSFEPSFGLKFHQS